MSSRLLRDFGLYLPAKVAPAVVGLVSIPLLARLLTPPEFGLLSLATASIGGGQIFHHWILDSLVRFYPAAREDSARRDLLRTALWAHGSTAAGLALGALAVVWAITDDRSLQALAVLAVLVFLAFGLYNLLIQLLRVQLEVRRYTRFAVWESTAGMVLGVLLVVVTSGGPFAMLVGYLIARTVPLPWLWRRAWPRAEGARGRFSSTVLRSMAGFGVLRAAGGASAWALNRVDRYQIQAVYGAAAVGTYSMAYQLGNQAIHLVSSAVRLSSSPLVNLAWETESTGAGLGLLRAATRLYLVAALPAAAGLAVLSQPLLLAMAGPAYAAHWPIVPWVVFAAFLIGLHDVFLQALSLVMRPGVILVALAFAAVLNVTLNWWLLPGHGAGVAAVTTFVAAVVLCAGQALVCSKLCPWPFPWATAARTLAAAGVMSSVVLAVLAVLAGSEGTPPWLAILVAVPLGIATYVVLLLTLREVTWPDIRRLLELGFRRARPGAPP